ncbi:MAG: hypothetical protein K2N34_10485 [Lachnospiraceae bacterium]|nr:hypothetical protein [Lachnospiraceae bacterium]
MKISSVLKQKKGDIPVWVWMVFAIIPVCFYCIYLYDDIVITTEDGIAFWYALLDQGSLNKYYVTPYPFRDGGYPLYDFFIYIIFAIWDLPLYIYEKISKISFGQNYFLILYAKSIVIFFLVIGVKELKKIVYHITNDEKKAYLSCFTYFFSVTTLQAVVIISGYDVISLFFTLCGIFAYLNKQDKKFIIYFSCAIGCKMFALWVFIPLVLLRYKKVWKVILAFLCGIGIMVIPKLYFLLYQTISGVQVLSEQEGMLTSANAVHYINDYLWSGEAPIATIFIPWLFFFTFILWVWCWFNKKQLSDKMIIYVCLIGMSIFMLTCFTHSQWMLLIMPYIAILECDTWVNLSEKLFCEVCMGFGHILWMVRHSSQLYSYCIVNNMLRLEDKKDEFFYTGIWQYISKLESISRISIDHIFIVFRGIFVASFVLLLIYLYPKASKQESHIKSTESGSTKLFYLKAIVSMSVLLIPLLGVINRMLGL